MKRPERPRPEERPRADVRQPAARQPAARPATPRAPVPLRTPENPTRTRAESTPSARQADRLRRKYEKAEMRRFTRASRRRRLGRFVVFAIVAVVAGLIATAVFSPILALREIRVVGASRIDPVEIQDAVSGQLGTPLALLDDARLRQELGQFTLIRSYATELVPPGTLVIHIVERSPLGAVATSTGFQVVDAAGVVLDSMAERPAGLPLLMVDSSGTSGTGFAAMTAVLLAMPPEVLSQVDSITARTRDDVTLTLIGNDQRVVWGSAEDSGRKAAILEALLARFAASGAGEYDVSAPGSAVFRLD